MQTAFTYLWPLHRPQQVVLGPPPCQRPCSPLLPQPKAALRLQHLKLRTNKNKCFEENDLGQKAHGSVNREHGSIYTQVSVTKLLTPVYLTIMLCVQFATQYQSVDIAMVTLDVNGNPTQRHTCWRNMFKGGGSRQSQCRFQLLHQLPAVQSVT